jgi:hypothetical protein
VLLVASDTPYPQPLHAARPLPDHFGVAFVLVPEEMASACARLAVEPLRSAQAGPISRCGSATLDALRRGVPAAAALPLLQALAGAPRRVVLDYLPALKLRVDVSAA